jgi:hypothetical protein
MADWSMLSLFWREWAVNFQGIHLSRDTATGAQDLEYGHDCMMAVRRCCLHPCRWTMEAVGGIGRASNSEMTTSTSSWRSVVPAERLFRVCL